MHKSRESIDKQQKAWEGFTEEEINNHKLAKRLLVIAKCPDENCDNNGTSAYQDRDGDWFPQPCQWCHDKKKVLESDK